MLPKRRERIRKRSRGPRLPSGLRSALCRTLGGARRACAGLARRLRTRTAELHAANLGLRLEQRERRAAERQLAIYAEAIRATGEAVAIADASRTLIDVNPACEDAMGRSRDELIGTPLYPIEPGRESESLHRELWHSLEANGHWAGEVTARHSNGDPFLSWVQIRTLREEAGLPTHYICVSRNITALRRSEEQLQRLAFYDSLTQLPNRALLNDRLRVALASAERRRDLIAVMYLDLDGFKEVNDTLGHAAGDALLVETGRRIGCCIRASDTLARTGGDEFTVLLARASSIEDVTLIAERILEAVAAPIQVAGRTVRVGTSIGVSFYPRDGQDAETLQLKADLAMYKAKKAGRGQYRVFEGELLAGKDRLSLTARLEAALAGDELLVFYQPIVDTATAGVDCAEALLRWRKPGGELTLPDAFLPHAEESGLIRRIDAWVLERACRDAGAWPGEATRPGVCVNLSGVAIQQPSLANFVASLLESTGLPPRQLRLEVTESAIVCDPQSARRTLEDIAALGVGWSLDDFGTGHSSLTYLTRFPIRGVKLDRTLVERIGRDSAAEELIRAILTLARRLDLDVVAKGVEHAHQQAFLSGAGCHLMQGYRFVRPMSGDMFPSWLASNGGRWLRKAQRLRSESGASGGSAS
jgi:diguanylate cyclase (GGDEF)-like protein/PAS domain S-box-containing protein